MYEVEASTTIKHAAEEQQVSMLTDCRLDDES
jgi:hypothetical protein